MDPKELLEFFRLQPKSIQELDLRAEELKAIPPNIARFEWLKTLNLSSNQLTALPAKLANLSNLRVLDVSNNRLASLPGEMEKLACLIDLDLSQNRLASLPAAMANLASLTTLNLSSNQFTSLSAKFGKIPNLTTLDLSCNRLTSLPVGMPSLTSLSLRSNQLKSLPIGLSSLSSLMTLDISQNMLTTVPNELTCLTRLTSLNLSDNKLTVLPAELGRLTNLTALYIDNNPLVFPPPEIVGQGTSAILSFLRKIQDERTSSRVWVSKLLLVGEGGVGKTSLLRQLRDEGFREGEMTTHGIEIQNMILTHPEIEDVKMNLVAWDFGGQEIYHATHQFFLTNRSLFLLLWNMRIGYMASKLEYWLETIKAKAPDSPVMIVATGIDDGRPVDLPLKELGARFPQIVGLWKVSNSTGTGINDLRDEIRKIAASLPLMGERWPIAWLGAADAIRSHTDRHISPYEISEIMIEHGLLEKDRDVLARWLHELGDILYFKDNSELNDVIILKPQWVNQEICKVLDSEDVKGCGGIFRRADRDRLWNDVDSGLRDLFLRLMEQFDLSYRTLADPELSLVVEHLSFDEHEKFQTTWEAFERKPGSKQITMKFVLSVMPPGIPTWFIARSHRFTQGIHWKRGALFGDPREKPEHLGLIRALPSDKIVVLTVRGPFPHNFFAVLRDGLEQTLKRFPGMEISRKIPCLGHSDGPCTGEFDLEYLQGAMTENPPVSEAQCPKRFKMVPIPELMFGLDWRHDEPVQRKLDHLLEIQSEMLGVQGEVLGELRELRAYVQREFSRALRRAQQLTESQCPAVFVLRPKSEGEWQKLSTWQKAELQLYCDAPGHWHPTSKGGRYEINVPSEWLRAIAPHVRALVKALKYAAPLVGPVLGYALPVLEEVVKNDVKLMEELVKKLPEIDIRKELDPDEANERWPNPARGAALRELRSVLDRVDPAKTYGGLCKVLTPEGDYLWLCEEHAQPYRR